MKTDIKIICDTCRYYERSPGGSVETCHALRDCYTRARNTLGFYYVDQRMNGNKNHCKEFKKF